MNTYLISDTHFNHAKIATYCDRPVDFTERIIKNCKQIVKPTDTVIHCGDVFIGKADGWKAIRKELPGKWILVRGNHDQHSCSWFMDNGFEFACDAMIFRGAWITHHPSSFLPDGCMYNIHGHLHNIWHGFNPDGGIPATRLHNPWQRLFAVEYTGYAPVEFDKFISHPKKYLATGLGD